MTYHSPHIKPSHVGLLHEEMGIPKGKKIGIGHLMQAKSKAKRAGNSKMVRQATFALNMNRGPG